MIRHCAMAAGLCATAGAQPAARVRMTINFNGLKGADGSAFKSYKQHGFSVVPVQPSSWLVGQNNFGDPPPGIYYENTGGTNSIQVTHGGATFTFVSIDFYSSITDIPYVFTGMLKGAVVYTVSGTVPNTFGNFAKVTNPDAADAIDTLIVTETNPPEGLNPVALDNIRLGTAGVP
jgi:hypothetical protein